MKPSSMILLTSTSMEGTNSGRNLHWPSLTGREPLLIAKWCTATLAFNRGISQYVQAKTSRNSVSKATYSISSSGVKRALTYVGRGYSVVSRLISYSSSTVALTCPSSPVVHR
ncbi:hypothetical protein LIER_27402 [Lithospermum erythrorhizon]|uniref:Uncharacterized protein n=1 Tax=Lithospermum erythrorhizon TaxID=34254 RepID=A0AAV3RDG9_LITER